MQNFYDLAHHAYQKNDLYSARRYYSLCQTALDSSITQDHKNAAKFMLAYLLSQEGSFQEALTHANFLKDQAIKTRLLPLSFLFSRKTILGWLQQAPLAVLTRDDKISLDLAGYSLSGKMFKDLLEAVQKKPNIAVIRFSNNPLNEQEVNMLLDLYLTRPHLNELDLSGLPINHEAAIKIKQIIEKIAQKPRETVDGDVFTIRVSSLASNDILLLKRELARSQQKKIQLIVGSDLQTTFVSAAMIHVISLQQKNTATLQPSSLEGIKKTKLENEANTHAAPEILYDAKGHIIGSITNINGHLKISIPEKLTLSMSMLTHILPCQSLVISAPQAHIIFDAPLSGLHSLIISSRTCQMTEKAVLHVPEIYIEDCTHLKMASTVYTDNIITDVFSLEITNAANFFFLTENAEQIYFKAEKLAIMGGVFHSKKVLLQSKDALNLPSDVYIKSLITQLRTDEKLTMSAQVTSQLCQFDTLKNCLISQEANIAASQCQITAQNLQLYGAVREGELIDLHIDEDFLIEGCASMESTHLAMKARHGETKGKINCDNLSAHVITLKLAGKINTKSLSKKDTQFSILAKALTIDTDIVTNSALAFKIGKLFMSSRGKILPASDMPDHDKEKRKQMSLIVCEDSGYFEEGSEISTHHPLKVTSQDLSLYGILRCPYVVQLEANGTGKIHDSGRIVSDEQVLLGGTRFWNSGEIEAKEGIHFATDYFFINGISDDSNAFDKLKQMKLLGKLKAKNITISTGFFLGLLSNIEADNSVQINALVEIYLGITQGKNVMRSNIVGVNLGLNLTCFKTIKGMLDFTRAIVKSAATDGKGIKSTLNAYYADTDSKEIAMTSITYALQVIGIAAKLLNIFAPQIGIPANLVLSGVNLLLQLAMNGVILKQEVCKLTALQQNGLTIRARHVYPLVLGIKNIAMTGTNIVSMGIGLPQMIQSLPQTIEQSHQDFLSLTPSFVGLFGGSVTEQSVLQVDALGATVTGLSNTTSAFHISALHANVSGVSFENSFLSQAELTNVAAAMRNINTTHFSETGGYQVVESESLSAQQAVLNGHTLTDHLTVMSQTLSQDNILRAKEAIIHTQQTLLQGDVKIDSGAILSDQLSISSNNNHSGLLQAENTVIQTKQVAVDGQMNLDHCALSAEHIKTQTHAEMGISNSAVTTKALELQGGSVMLQGVAAEIDHLTQDKSVSLAVKQSKLTLTDTAEINGNVALNESLLESSATVNLTQASKVSLQDAEINAKEIHHTLGSQLDAHHSLEKGDKVTYQGQSRLEGSMVEGTDVKLCGEMQAKESYFKGEQVTFSKDLQGELTESFVEGTMITQEAQAQLQIDQSGFQGNVVELAGTTTVNRIFSIEAAEKLQLDETSEIQKGEESIFTLKTPHLESKGTVQVEQACLEGSLTSDEINQLAQDPHLHVTTLQIMTDQNVSLNQTFTSADDVIIVGKSVNSNAEQHLHTIDLESTEGNVTVNEQITTTGFTYIQAEGQAKIYDTIRSGDLEIYGKSGVLIEEKTHSTTTHNHTNRFQYGPYHAPSLSPKKSPEGVVYAPTVLQGETVAIKSDVDITIHGVTIHGMEQTALLAKGDIVFDINQHNKPKSSTFSYLNTAHSRTPVSQTLILGDQVLIEGHHLTNNGQAISGHVVTVVLDGNLYNQNQGGIAATGLLSVEAQNVYNTCEVKKMHGENGDYMDYAPSYLLGGDGSVEGAEGVGLYIHAAKQVINDASHILSAGSNVVDADWGFTSTPRSSEYIYKQEKTSFFGLNKNEVEIKDAHIYRPSFVSLAGQNTINCKHGAVYCVATDFAAQKGTVIYSSAGSKFYDLVFEREVKQHSKTLGIFHTNEESYDQYTSPTIIQDQTGITLASDQTITMRGTEVITPGLYQVIAQNYKASVSVLEHSYHRDTFGMSATLFNQEFLKSNTPCDFSQSLWNGDPTANALQQLGGSHSVTEGLLNSWSAGITLANTTNALLNGLRTNTLLTEGLKYGLPSVFAPQLSINLTWTKTTAQSQSLGAGRIQVGSAHFDVKDSIKFKGMPMQTLGDFVVNCKTFTVEGDQLTSSMDQKTVNVNLTVSSTGDPYQVGVSSCHNHTDATQQVNDHIKVGGTFDVHANTLTLDGAVIDTGKITGQVNHLSIITHADHVESKSESMGASTGGNFNYNQQTSESSTVTEASGIHVKESINGQGTEFTVGHLSSIGGQITSEKLNYFQADEITAQDVEEYAHSSGFGICGNIKDFKQDTQVNHLLPPGKQSAQITTTNINVNQSKYRADNQTVISGAEGTKVESHRISGNVVSNLSDSKNVTENSSHNYNIVIPHMTQETREQFKENYHWAKDKLVEGEHKVQKVMTDFFKKKPPVVSGDKDNQQDHTHDDKPFYHHGKSGGSTPSREALDEAYRRGKLAGLTGHVLESVENYSDEERAYFDFGMSEKRDEMYATLAIIGVSASILGPEILPVLVTPLLNIATLGLRSFGLFKSATQIIETSREIIERIASKQSQRDPEELLEYLSEREQKAYKNNPERGSRFMGQAVHRATKVELKGEFDDRFEYYTKGPDFYDKVMDQYVELTTPKCSQDHLERYQAKYPDLEIVLYDLPKMRP